MLPFHTFMSTHHSKYFSMIMNKAAMAWECQECCI